MVKSKKKEGEGEKNLQLFVFINCVFDGQICRFVGHYEVNLCSKL